MTDTRSVSYKCRSNILNSLKFINVNKLVDDKSHYLYFFTWKSEMKKK